MSMNNISDTHSVAVAVLRIHSICFPNDPSRILLEMTVYMKYRYVSITLLLYGILNLSNDTNTEILESVHKCILKTNRFSSN